MSGQLPIGRVAVIGNGPVGQTAALLLARWGVPVTILDRRPSRSAIGSKAICQQRDVLDIWSSVGAEQIAREGVTWTTARTYFRDRELFGWSFVDRGHSPLPAFVNVSQCTTEALLDRLIAEQPLIDVRWDHDVVDVRQDARGVELGCTTAAGPRQIRAGYAVAAAGAQANELRELLGVTFDGQTFDDRFLICDIRADLPGWETERRFYFDPDWNPGRQVLIHPCPDSTYRIDWQVPAGFDLDHEVRTGELDRRIRHIIGAKPYELVWKSVYRFHARKVDRMRVGRVLLAGDFAHLVAPFGARGLNSGVADAENAAWKLAFVLRGWAPETLLDSYDTERSAAAEENLDVSTETMRFLVPQGPDEQARRQRILAAAVHDSEIRGQVDSGRFAEPFWYVDSALTTPNPARAFGGRPPRGESPAAGPGVLVPDGPVRIPGRPAVRRLRQLTRSGLLVLVTPDDDSETDEGARARVASVAQVLAGTTAAPTAAVRLADIDTDGVIARALAARPGEAWLLRPDGHVAAVVASADRAGLAAAARRALGTDPSARPAD